MVTQDSDGGQAALEVKAARILASAPDEKKTVREIFGAMKEWMFELGPYRFLLIPYNREWWFWDPVHKDWQYTGHHAGEVVFALNGNTIEFQLPEKGTAVPAGAAVPPPEKKVCPQCGAQVREGLKFCTGCGHKLV